MGYDIYIGERLNDTVFAAEDPAAPNKDPLAPHENHRHPSYTGWHNFAREVGLEDFFFDKEKGKMREHPGIQPLTVLDARTVLDALERARQNTDPDFAYQIERLEWLAFWVEWAVKNCQNPAIYNS